ncbi:PQQ-binding-like beta-propeller repeat protein [Halovenus rubra]|uniref:PQQ-binding-like beta-propeller repeat protein n=2 Tax=Halovenus rubra TaxID=869890 RepID=A0ABD5X9R8_9EURY|nr:PQQ-binding-like beta-propeller repeat protein [Halovenus rubra]
MSDYAARFAHDAPGVEAAESLHIGSTYHVYGARLDGSRVRIVTPAPDALPDTRAMVTDRFEAWSAHSTHHALTTVHASGETPRPWLAVDTTGAPLPDVAPLSPEDARTVIAPIAEALRKVTATEGRIPVEPTNIRILAGNSGETQISGSRLDWPLRAELPDQSPYVPPATGEEEASAGRDIVFQLGALASYAVTATPPADDGEETHRDEQSRSPNNSELPAAFEAVIDTALESIPGERYDSPYAFKRALMFESQPAPDPDPKPEPEHRSAERGETNTGLGAVDTPEHDDWETSQSSDNGGVSRRTVLGALGVSVATTTGGAWFATRRLLGSEAETFPTFRYDRANTGYAPDAVGPTEGITEAWSVDATAEVRASPVVGKQTAIITSSIGTAYALDTATGSERWREEIAEMGFISATIEDNLVYLIEKREGQPGAVVARTLQGGSERWRREISQSQYRTPVLGGNTLYVPGAKGITAFELGGDRQWTSEEAAITSLTGALNGETLYVSGVDNMPDENVSWDGRTHGVIALDTSDGSKRWLFEMEDFTNSSPAVANETVYVGKSDGDLVAINTADGSERWRFETDDGITASPAVTDYKGGTVYICTLGGKVYAIDSNTAEQRWSVTVDRQIISSPAVVSDTVYTGGQNGIYALDVADGTERWRFETDGPVVSSPAVVSNTVFVGSDDGTIYALTEP